MVRKFIEGKARPPITPAATIQKENPPTFGFVAAHGAYFGRRLRALAGAERRAPSVEEARPLAERRRALQRFSFGVSMLDLVVSAAIVVLAVGVQG